MIVRRYWANLRKLHVAEDDPKRSSWTLDRSLALGVSVGTILLAGFTGWLALETHNAVVDSRENSIEQKRAWVSPVNAWLSVAPKAGTPLDFKVSYRNSGIEPALKLDHQLAPFMSSGLGEPADSNEFHDLEGSLAKQCLTLDANGSAVAYPSASPDPYTETLPLSGTAVTDDIVSGKRALIIAGCFAYLTEGQVHHTAFCFYYRATNSKDISHLPFCDTGQLAD